MVQGTQIQNVRRNVYGNLIKEAGLQKEVPNTGCRKAGVNNCFLCPLDECGGKKKRKKVS